MTRIFADDTLHYEHLLARPERAARAFARCRCDGDHYDARRRPKMAVVELLAFELGRVRHG